MKNITFINEALAQARIAAENGEVPVGAVIVQAGKIIALAHNLVETDKDPTAHAEIIVIRAASKILRSPRLIECDLYVTLEPCAMCAQAIAFARIRRLYFGASDEKGGGVEHGAHIFSQTNCNHKPEIYSGIAESECSNLLKDFFRRKR